MRVLTCGDRAHCHCPSRGRANTTGFRWQRPRARGLRRYFVQRAGTWCGANKWRWSPDVGPVVRASSVEKLVSLQKARRKGSVGGGEGGGGRRERRRSRGATRNETAAVRGEATRGLSGTGKRNEKVTGRGGKSSNVNTEHVAMRRKHPAPANLFTKGGPKVRYVLAGVVERNE